MAGSPVTAVRGARRNLAVVPTVPTRREPPPFRRCRVAAVEDLSPRLRRVRLSGEELTGLEPGLPAASVRLLLPRADGQLELPTWEGNEFLLADGSRPAIRTLTPRRSDPEGGELVGEIVRHDSGALSDWVATARPGDPTAVSGTGRGFDVDPQVGDYVLVGDESALPAISTLLEAIPDAASVRVVLETPTDDCVELPAHPRSTVEWVMLPDGAAPGDAMLRAVTGLELGADTVVWAAGEAAGVQRIRKHLFDERDVPRRRAHVRGYWKHGRDGAGG
jgi:NADPH-dependent ferric siderophore reductase